MNNILLKNSIFLKGIIIKTIIFSTGIFLYVTLEEISFFFENIFHFCTFMGLIFLINVKQPLVLKNLFIVYSSIFFSIAGYFFFPDKRLYIDMLIYIFSFLAGYSFAMLKGKNKLGNNIVLPVKSVEKYIWGIIIGISITLIINIIVSGGISSYYSKDFFSDNIENYGKKDFSSGLNTILSFGFSICTICFIALYVNSVIQHKVKLNYYYLIYLLLIYPLLSLSRGNFMYGIITLTYIYSVDKDKRGIFNKKLILSSLVGVGLLMLVVVGIGTLRQEKINDSGKGNTDIENNKGYFFIIGELVNITSYQWIKEETSKNGYQYGNTMIAPYVLKIVPRSWYPEKPINSGAFFSKKNDPESYDNGFMIPSSFFGDAYLNFGLLGTILFCIMIGFIFGNCDRNYVNGNTDFLATNIIIYYYFYPLIRDELSDSGFMITISLLIISLLNFFLSKKKLY